MGNAISRVCDFVRKHTAPPEEFLDERKFKMPSNPFNWVKRLITNIGKFKGNYMLISSGSFVYNLWATPYVLPLMFIPIALFFAIRNGITGDSITVFGRTFSKDDLYTYDAIIVVPLLFASSAISCILTAAGFSALVILTHSSFYNAEEDTTTARPTNNDADHPDHSYLKVD